MEMVSDLLRANQIDLSRYLSQEQMDWLESEGYSTAKQYRLVEQIRGFNLRHDRNPMPVDDATLRMVVEDERDAARARSNRALLEIVIKIGFALAVVASFYGLRAMTSIPTPTHTVRVNGSPLSYQIVLKNGMAHRGEMPSRSQKLLRRSGRGLLYMGWVTHAPNHSYKMVVLNDGVEYYDSGSTPVEAHGRYQYMYAEMSDTRLRNWEVNINVDGDVLATHSIPIGNEPLAAWWIKLLIIGFWGIAYLLLQAFYFRS
jgi:hypothetical protein